MTKNIIAVAGPTASGKTALAARLALEIGGEVISNDSMQIYKGMEIGCATPTAEEMLGVPHHLLSFMSPTDDFSCADYGTLAKAKADEVISRGKIPVFCGGTGLYLDSVITVGSMLPRRIRTSGAALAMAAITSPKVFPSRRSFP